MKNRRISSMWKCAMDAEYDPYYRKMNELFSEAGNRIGEGAHSLYNKAANAFGGRNPLEQMAGNARVAAHELYDKGGKLINDFSSAYSNPEGSSWSNSWGSRLGRGARGLKDNISNEIAYQSTAIPIKAEQAWNSLSNHASNAWNNVSNQAGNAMNSLSNHAGNAINSLGERIDPYWDSLKDNVSEGWNNLSDRAEEASGKLADYASNAWNGLSPTMQSALKYGGIGLGALGAGYGLYKAFGGGNKPAPPKLAKRPMPTAGVRPMNRLRPANGNMGAGGQPKGWITTRTGKKVPVYK